jgi:hypothetical protein
MSMATNALEYNPTSRTAWGAIFGGTFVYLTIMATFGALGAAIFASAPNGTGLRVWMTILTIISLYFAGRASGRLVNTTDRNIGTYQGLITFGMSVFTTVLLLGIAFLSAAPYSRAAAATTRVSGDLVSVGASGGWYLFVALFLGMLCCVAGGSQSVPRAKATVTEHPGEARRVA